VLSHIRGPRGSLCCPISVLEAVYVRNIVSGKWVNILILVAIIHQRQSLEALRILHIYIYTYTYACMHVCVCVCVCVYI